MEIFVTERDEITMKGIYDYLTGNADTMPSEAESMLHRFLKNIEFMHKTDANDKKMQSHGESKEIWYDIPMTLKFPRKLVSLTTEYQVSNTGHVRSKGSNTVKTVFTRNKASKTDCVSLQCNGDNGVVYGIAVTVDKLVYAACTGKWDVLSIQKKDLFMYIDGDPKNHAFSNIKLNRKQ